MSRKLSIEIEKAKAIQMAYGFSLMSLQSWAVKTRGRVFRVENEGVIWKITLTNILVKDLLVECKSQDLQTAIDNAIKRFG